MDVQIPEKLSSGFCFAFSKSDSFICLSGSTTLILIHSETRDASMAWYGVLAEEGETESFDRAGNFL